MTAPNQLDKQYSGAKEQLKIVLNDIEFKEKQFMDDEFQYYKNIKTKPKKKHHSDQMQRHNRRLVQRSD